MSNFDSSLALASEQILTKMYALYEAEDDLREFKHLSERQVIDLGNRILALPDDDIAMLIFHYSYDINYNGIAALLKQSKIKGKLRHIERILSSGMGLLEDEGIDKDSMRRACKIALDEYTRVDDLVIVPKYSRKFTKKMRELKVIRGSSIYVKLLQKVAVIFIMLGLGFGTALGINADFREMVFRASSLNSLNCGKVSVTLKNCCCLEHLSSPMGIIWNMFLKCIHQYTGFISMMMSNG